MRPAPEYAWVDMGGGIFILKPRSNNPFICSSTHVSGKEGRIREHLPNVPNLHFQNEDDS
jgi:hypothetical protein